ncbi:MULTISPECIES: ABC transporter substrate-binding protein [Paenibacillus]|uniref:ABC transporter substrate-binding protein n=1 Tax=Paenibacillus TaxID=44249 RepID=UPI002FE21655
MIIFRKLHKPLILFIVCLLAAGCANTGNQAKSEQRTLKVMFGDEGYFYQTYGDLFAMRYPNVNIEVVSMQSLYNGEEKDPKKALKELVEKEQPDILMLDNDSYSTLASEGLLMDLETLIDREKFDTASFFPGMVETLREQGGGKLYGLSPSFRANVIYYNADLFAKYGVEVPHDGMTWQDIIDTARRFPTDGDEKSRVYGFGGDYGFQLQDMVGMIARTHGIKEVDPKTKKVTVNTEGWKKAYQLALDAVESKAIYNPQDGGFQGGTMEEFYQSQPFLMGRMAMTTDSSNFLQNLKEAKGRIKGYKPFQLGIVAGPVDPARPDETRGVYFNRILSIRANTPNVEAAWDFMGFVHGEEFAKIKSRTLNEGMLTRMGYTKEFDGVSLDAFYKLKPSAESTPLSSEDEIPSEFYEQYYSILSREIGLLEKKSKSVDDVLKTIEQEGQVQLDKALKDKQNKKNKEGN